MRLDRKIAVITGGGIRHRRGDRRPPPRGGRHRGGPGTPQAPGALRRHDDRGDELGRVNAEMFVSIRRYFVHKAPAKELAELVDQDFADRLSAQPGFVSYEFLDGGDGE